MTKHYVSSGGERREIASMATEHLASAVAKLKRNAPHRSAEISAMETELAGRPAAAPRSPRRRGRF